MFTNDWHLLLELGRQGTDVDTSPANCVHTVSQSPLGRQKRAEFAVLGRAFKVPSGMVFTVNGAAGP